jgi:DNA-binding CsgD family transcriptional regulator
LGNQIGTATLATNQNQHLMSSPTSLKTGAKDPLHSEPSIFALEETLSGKTSSTSLPPLKSSHLDYAVLSDNIGGTVELNFNSIKDFTIEVSEVFDDTKSPRHRALLLTISEKKGEKNSFLINIGQLLSKISSDGKRDGGSQNNGSIHFESIYHSLSLREQQVLVEVSKGHTSKEIASELFISENTVKNHRKNIKKKLSFKDCAAFSKFLKWSLDYSRMPMSD